MSTVIKTASVKVMISHNYNHFETSMTLENENENVNEIKDTVKKGVQGEDIISDESLAMIFDDLTIERYQTTFRQINVKDQLQKFILKVRGSPLDYQHRDSGGIRKAFQYHLEHARQDKTIPKVVKFTIDDLNQKQA